MKKRSTTPRTPSDYAARRKRCCARNEQLQFVVDYLPVFIAHCDHERRYKFVNRFYAEMFGLRPADMIGKHLRDVLGEEAYAQASPYMEMALAGQATEYDLMLPAPPGGPRAVHASYAPEHDASGRVVGFIAAITDITERKRAEAQLAAAEAQLRALFASIQSQVLVIDREGVHREIAPIDPGFLYQSPEELLGKNLRDIFPAEQAEFFIETIRQVLESRQTIRIEYELSIGERQVWFVAAISPMDEERTLWVAHDITHHKQIHTELAEAHANLRAVTDYWQRSIENERISIARELHDDFGQTMTALKMDINWLVKRLPEGNGRRQRLDGMNTLVDNSIRLMRRIATQLRPTVLDNLGLNATLEWQAGEFFQRTGIPCQTDLSPDDLGLDPALNTSLFRILQELLTNAARHAHATRVDISLRQKDQCVLLTVQDNGRGITEREIADPSSLGLLGLRERAAQWRGSLTLLGAPGKGTTAIARIPLPASPANRNDP